MSKPNTTEALEAVKRLGTVNITAAQAATVIGCDPAYIREQARFAPHTLPFPVIIYRSRVKIPRLCFLACFEPQ